MSRRLPACGLRLAAWTTAAVAVATPLPAQSLAQRGFLEARAIVYPQTASNDSTRLVGDVILREEVSWKPASWITLAGGLDLRADSHRRVDRSWDVDFGDRGALRPAIGVRRASVSVHRSGLTLEAGKQFVRWGKADVLNPTDRFAPRDFMEVVDSEFLGITALRATWERGPDTIDGVWQPRVTPSRTPGLGDRWAGAAARLAAGTPLVVGIAPTFPGRSQAGIRWNHLAPGFEFSLSAFDGFNHLPTFALLSVPGSAAQPPPGAAYRFRRFYPRMRMLGADAAVPLRWLTVKGEAAHFISPDGDADDHGIYVLQVERQAGEWLFVGGYAGEWVAKRRETAVPGFGVLAFAPDRGLAGTFLGRASYTIDVNRSVAFEGAARRNGKGAWLKTEYSQAAGQHWRATLRANLIRGSESDFLGQYRKNSNVDLVLRYSF